MDNTEREKGGKATSEFIDDRSIRKDEKTVSNLVIDEENN
jgi:hypothetical protein